MLRLASSKVVPNAVLAIASQPFLSGSITTVERENCVSKQSSFSTVADAMKKADKGLAKSLRSEIKSTKELVSNIQMPETPTGRRFKIKPVIPGEGNIKSPGNIKLTGDFDGEKLEINVGQPLDRHKGPCFFSVTIKKENKKMWMYLSCWAHGDSISIKSVEFKGSPYIEDSILQFSENDKGDMEDYWIKQCLGSRGIDETFSSFLVDMINKFRCQRLICLEKFLKFVK